MTAGRVRKHVSKAKISQSRCCCTMHTPHIRRAGLTQHATDQTKVKISETKSAQNSTIGQS